MPVTTRSMSRGQPGLSYIPAKKRARSDIEAKDSFPKSGKTTSPRHSSQRSRKRLRKKNPTSGGIERILKALESAPPDIPDNAVMHWGCRICSCPRGAFEYPTNACIHCGHEMDDHEEIELGWNPGCAFVCNREILVKSILNLVQTQRVVVIRATPLVGKSTLLLLLGRRAVDTLPYLEPVYIDWADKTQRNDLSCEDFLRRKESEWRKINARYRQPDRTTRTLYLIDEAQNSYDESNLWSRILKNRNTRLQSLFVLSCVYGAAGVSRSTDSIVESHALSIDSLQRVELRQSTDSGLYMLFKPEETTTTVTKWAIQNRYIFEKGVPEYLHTATDGHPGMVGLILQYFDMSFSQLSDTIRHTRAWTRSLCHDLLVKHDGLVKWLSKYGRGVWTSKLHNHVKGELKHPIYQHLSFSDVQKVLREVVLKPNGHTRVPTKTLDAFAFCHRHGMLHTERTFPGSEELRYIFASPIHRRVAYRRLFPGPDPNTDTEPLTLRQTSLNAIQRFSPSALQPRSIQNPARWGIPEAAFQDEIYCCLNHELHNLPILSEYSHTDDGRVDFYIYEKKWCIEILQCGNKTELAKHIARFATGGKYRAWNIFEDYIILNFCSKSTLKKIDIKDTEIQPHILQIVIDSEECAAEVYTYDKKLLATFGLGEGRQRPRADEYDLPPENADALKYIEYLQARAVKTDQEKEELKRQMEQMEQEKQEMKRQMEQMKLHMLG